MAKPYVIIGDGIAGSSAAETIREQDPDADIVVITDEAEPLYNRILIKEYAKAKMPEAPIHIHDEDWYAERDITLKLNTTVVDVDVDEHEVVTEDETIPYHKLLIATGGTPRHLPIPNSDADGVHRFWTFEDARRIKEAASDADDGVIIGAGLLGIDLAAVCGAHDIEANYLMRGNRWWRYALTEDGADIIHRQMRDMGVEPVFGVGARRFVTDDSGHVTGVVDTEGTEHPADFVGVAIGLDYNTEFLSGTDVETEGGILVDETMKTAADDVYAAGDIVRYHDVILGERNQNGSWDSAQEQGKVAGKNMVTSGGHTFNHVSSYSITHFDTPFLSFGFPTKGDRSCSRQYSDTEWRRLTFKDGKLIGGVLIGDISPQRIYKKLIRAGVDVGDNQQALLKKQPDGEEIGL